MAEVRRVRAGEWERWRDLRLRALSESPEAFGSTYEREVGFTREEWTRRTDSAATFTDRALFIATDGDAWVGCAGVYPAEGIPEIMTMWVDPDQRGSGVGLALLTAAVEFGRANGARVVRLCHMPDNLGAHSLYAQFGFRPTGRVVALDRDPSVELVEMELPLT